MGSLTDKIFDDERQKMEKDGMKRMKDKMIKMIKDLDYDDTVIVKRFLYHRGDIQKFFELTKILGRSL